MNGGFKYGATILVLAACVAIMIFIKRVLIKKVAYKSRKEKQNTVDGLIFNILQYVVIILTIFVILTVNGVEVTALLASLGIVATIVGLSLQDTFKDLFAGINIYGNNFYKVGDYVKYNGEICVVKYFNARITKFRSIISGSTFTVSNSTISSIEKLKTDTMASFMFDFDVDKDIIDEAMEEVTKDAVALDTVISATYLSLCNIADNGCQYILLYSAVPKDQAFVKADICKMAYREFKKRGIAPQFDSDRDIVVADKHRGYTTYKPKKMLAKLTKSSKPAKKA